MLTGKSLVCSLEVNPWDMIRQVVLMECQSSHPMLSGLLFKPIVPTDCIEQSWKMPIVFWERSKIKLSISVPQTPTQSTPEMLYLEDLSVNNQGR